MNNHDNEAREGGGEPRHTRQEQIYYAYEQSGGDSIAVAEQLGVSPTYIRGAASKYRTRYIFGREPEPEYPLPLYTGAQEITGDAMIVGDLHIPTTDYDLLGVMLKVAHRHLAPPRTLILAGDLFNMDAISMYQHITEPIPLRVELKTGKRVIRHLLKLFDRIHYFMGNHDVRLHKQLEGADLLGGEFGEFGDRLMISPYPFMRVCSGGVNWHISHPRNYSRNKLITANELAQKHQMNVISWHEHHAAVGRDKYNRYTVINGGGLFEPDMMAYVRLNDSTSPEMSKGFVLLRNGVGHLITPYPSMTDLSMWLPRRKEAKK